MTKRRIMAGKPPAGKAPPLSSSGEASMPSRKERRMS